MVTQSLTYTRKQLEIEHKTLANDKEQKDCRIHRKITEVISETEIIHKTSHELHARGLQYIAEAAFNIII